MKGKAERKGRAWRPKLPPRNNKWGAFSCPENLATAIKIPVSETSTVENVMVESPVMDALEWIFIPVHEVSKGDNGCDTPPLSNTTSAEEMGSWDWIPLDVSFLLDELVQSESSVDCVIHMQEDD
jgi:hypothetical protein